MLRTRKQVTPKHRVIYRALRADIDRGRWQAGARLPSEAELVRRFDASRITVGRAMRDLQQEGLVERRAGSGTYVADVRGSGRLSFGLLIPDLGETDIFEPICQGMMASPLAAPHALVWGSPSGQADRGEAAWQLCRQYIERHVDGVFFAPLESGADRDDVNRRIVDGLDAANIPVVLLDRTALPYPQRGHHDLVGIDNRRAGYLVTEHLAATGCRRIAFVSVPHAAATVAAREAGYREALYCRRLDVDRTLVHHIDPDFDDQVRGVLAARPDGIVCANDRTAARLMQALLRIGVRIPDDVRMAGIDDVEYARLLPVPLTTLRQPTREIGDAALNMMLERVARRDLPTRDVLLKCEIVVRSSCGAGPNPDEQERE